MRGSIMGESTPSPGRTQIYYESRRADRAGCSASGPIRCQVARIEQFSVCQRLTTEYNRSQVGYRITGQAGKLEDGSSTDIEAHSAHSLPPRKRRFK